MADNVAATRECAASACLRFVAVLDQISLTYRFNAEDKAAGTFDPSFLPPTVERSVSDAPSR